MNHMEKKEYEQNVLELYKMLGNAKANAHKLPIGHNQ